MRNAAHTFLRNLTIIALGAVLLGLTGGVGWADHTPSCPPGSRHPGGKADQAAQAVRAKSFARSGLRDIERRYQTIATGRTRENTFIASSRANVSSSVPSNAGVKRGDLFVRGKEGVHGEIKVITAAEKRGEIIEELGASNKICKNCAARAIRHNSKIRFATETK